MPSRSIPPSSAYPDLLRQRALVTSLSRPSAMSHPYLTPSSTPAVQIALVPNAPDMPERSERSEGSETPSAPNPRVRYAPSPDGSIHIVGVTLKGQWVAEYWCGIEDFDERTVRAMERRVKKREARDLRILK